MVPNTYKMLVSQEELTEDNVRLANILGWCVEFVSYFQLKFIFVEPHFISSCKPFSSWPTILWTDPSPDAVTLVGTNNLM